MQFLGRAETSLYSFSGAKQDTNVETFLLEQLQPVSTPVSSKSTAQTTKYLKFVLAY